MYRVIKKFRDLRDNNHVYSVGDAFPREGMEPSEERIAELAGKKNRLGIPLIEEIPERPKRTRKAQKEE